MTKAIVTGIAGQDGFFMARLLAAKGIAVLGLTTDLARAEAEFPRAAWPGLSLMAFDYTQPGRFAAMLDEHAPDFVFNFAAKATGQGMFDAPFEMTRLNGTFVVDILEALRHSPRRDRISFCQASSSEMFGNVQETPQSELTPLRPKSPYGAAKVYAHNMVGIYRATYGLRCSSAILYNHESVRRSTQFVTRKIAHGAASIKLGLSPVLALGALDTQRDWGYAPEYVNAMYLMASAATPDDYVVCSGRLNTIQRLCEIAFGYLGLDYRDHVTVNPDARRAVESVNLHGDPGKILRDLGWKATRPIEEIMVELVNHELELLRRPRAMP